MSSLITKLTYVALNEYSGNCIVFLDIDDSTTEADVPSPQTTTAPWTDTSPSVTTISSDPNGIKFMLFSAIFAIEIACNLYIGIL